MVSTLAFIIVLALLQQATCRVHFSFQRSTTVPGHQPGRTLAQSGLAASDSLVAEPARIPGHYIVFFKPEAGPAGVAAQSLVAEVVTALAKQSSFRGAAAITADSNPTDDKEPTQEQAATDGLEILKPIGGSGTADAVHSAAAASTTESSPLGVQAVLVKASRRALRQIKRSALVHYVIQDREIVSQQTVDAAQQLETAAAALAATVAVEPQQAFCVQAADVAQGISATASTGFVWTNCRPTGSKLIWKGQACGDGSKVQYTELRSVNQQGSLISNCILRPDPARPVWTRLRFGSCGVQPGYTTSLPVTICSPTSAGGGTGSAPSTGGNLPRSGPVMRRVPVVAGEQVSNSLRRIEAVTAAGIDSTEGLPLSRQTTVAIIDSGIDGTHPDLNVVGGKTWATPSTAIAGDVANFDVDFYGHGTHVAGIVGARNSGQGVVGVVPNTPLYSLKVLNGAGHGTLSSALDAVKWTYSSEGKAARIGVINLSVAAKFDTASSTYSQDIATICSVFREASNAGIVVTASAGNYATSVRGYIPAVCPTVIAVSSIDAGANTASSFSNFLPAGATAAEKSTMIAGPGANIFSTMSYKKDASGFKTLSGTSMASPHVAGVAAACIMSGACAAGTTGAQRIAAIQAAAQERLSLGDSGAAPNYGYTVPTNGNYFGPLVWAKW